MNPALIIKEIGRGAKGARSLSEEQAHALFADLLAGRTPDLELGAIMLALRIKGESAAEMIGFKKALDTLTRQIDAPSGPRTVILPTYNGGRKEANLMPLVAFLLQREGIPVLIQGRHDFETRVSPFELLAALGVHSCNTLQEAGDALAQNRLACVQLDLLCPELVCILALRLRLGVRNVGHTLAKLIDPCPGRSVRVVALTHPHFLETMQEVLQAEAANALLMRGTEGEPYANPRRRPALLGFTGGQAQVLFEQITAEVAPESTADCAVAANAQLIRTMLAGEVAIPQPILDQVAALRLLACA